MLAISVNPMPHLSGLCARLAVVSQSTVNYANATTFSRWQKPQNCAQVTLMPVKELGVDAAVLYADIMLPLEGIGVSLEIQPEVGPIIHNPIRTMQDVHALRIIDAEES